VALVKDPFTGDIIEQNTIRTICLSELQVDQNISQKLRKFFGSIGILVLTILPDAQAEEFECE
jgi:hypothetical protein